MKIFDGKQQAQKVEEEIRNYLGETSGIEKKVLGIVQIGNDLSSAKFIQIKVNLCEKLGIKSCVYKINESESDDYIFQKVKEIFGDGEVVGGIIQLPLPRKSLYEVLNLIPREKDIDVISTQGKENFYSGDFSVLPPVVRSFENFVESSGIKLDGLKCVVVGDGDLVGKPLSFYLSKKGATVNALSYYDGKSKLDCQLLILCAGVPNLVKGDNILEGCHVVDFGSSIVDGKCVGDLDLSSGLDKLGWVSKSPGGMGPLVVRYLIKNFLGIKIYGLPAVALA